MEKTGKHISFNKEARKHFLEFALDLTTPWSGNFRDLNALVVRMATLADAARKLYAVSLKSKASAGNANKQPPLTSYLPQVVRQ